MSEEPIKLEEVRFFLDLCSPSSPAYTEVHGYGPSSDGFHKGLRLRIGAAHVNDYPLRPVVAARLHVVWLEFDSTEAPGNPSVCHHTDASTCHCKCDVALIPLYVVNATREILGRFAIPAFVYRNLRYIDLCTNFKESGYRPFTSEHRDAGKPEQSTIRPLFAEVSDAIARASAKGANDGSALVDFEIVYVPGGLITRSGALRLNDLLQESSWTRRIDPVTFFKSLPLLASQISVLTNAGPGVAATQPAIALYQSVVGMFSTRPIFEIRDEYDNPYAGEVFVSLDDGSMQTMIEIPSADLGAVDFESFAGFLSDPGKYDFVLEIPRHFLTGLPSGSVVDWDQRVRLFLEPELVNGFVVHSHAAFQCIYMDDSDEQDGQGVEKNWFPQPSAPLRRFTERNRVTPLIDGIATFREMAARIRDVGAGGAVRLAGWWFDDDTEMDGGDTFHELVAGAHARGATIHVIAYAQMLPPNAQQNRSQLNDIENIGTHCHGIWDWYVRELSFDDTHPAIAALLDAAIEEIQTPQNFDQFMTWLIEKLIEEMQEELAEALKDVADILAETYLKRFVVPYVLYKMLTFFLEYKDYLTAENFDLIANVDDVISLIFETESVDVFLKIGSHHQKILVVQSDPHSKPVAFVGGVDLNPDRLDDGTHGGPSLSFFQHLANVAGGGGFLWDEFEPKPFHDVHCLIEGPAVLEIDGIVAERWNAHPLTTSQQKPVMSLLESTVGGSQSILAGGQFVHVSVTRPRTGTTSSRSGTLKALWRAIAKARKFIYIEDQYLWSPNIPEEPDVFAAPGFIDHLREAVKRIDYLLVLIPNTLQDAEDQYRWRRHQFLESLKNGLSQSEKERIHVYFLQHRTTGASEIYVHSKVWIIDDVYAKIGSSNISRRSMTHDSELDVHVIDGNLWEGARRFAKGLRVELWAEHMGTDAPMLEDYMTGLEQWKTASLRPGTRVFAYRDAENADGAPVQEPVIDFYDVLQPFPKTSKALANAVWELVIDPEGR